MLFLSGPGVKAGGAGEGERREGGELWREGDGRRERCIWGWGGGEGEREEEKRGVLWRGGEEWEERGMYMRGGGQGKGKREEGRSGGLVLGKKGLGEDREGGV